MALTGPYTTEAEALAFCAGSGGGSPGACPACVVDAGSVTVTITGGSIPGTYSSAWVDMGGYFTASFILPGGYLNIVCGGAVGWDIGGASGYWDTSITTEGPPASVVYSNTGAPSGSENGPGGTPGDPVTAITVATC